MGLEKISEEEVEKSEELKCDVCGKTGFKSKAGLEGHKKIAHGADKRKTIPDEIGKRLENLETQLASTINPKKVIESEEAVRTALELLLPAAKKYDVALGPFGKSNPVGWGFRKREWVVKKASECPKEYF